MCGMTAKERVLEHLPGWSEEQARRALRAVEGWSEEQLQRALQAAEETGATMATHGEQTIGEIDVVAFTEAIDKVEGTGKWPAGTRGTVVSDYGDHKEVEISDADNYGATLDMPVVPVEKLKLISKHS